MNNLLPIIILYLSVACAAPASRGEQKARRRQMEKSAVVLESPKEYEKRTLKRDPASGTPTTYDPSPRVEPVDAKAGKYALKWIGYDGKEKVVEYQRADAVDAVVSASVSRTPGGQYLYTYRVSNLPSSPTYLSSFVVQNFASDAKPVEVNGRPTNAADLRLLPAFRESTADGRPRNFEGLYFGEMSRQISEFRDGNWIHMAVLSDFEPAVTPGREIELKLLSSAPPGVVGCRVTAGSMTLKGAGEHMPTELEDAMPGYEEWPKGYTVGPTGELASLPRQEWIGRLLGRLPLMEKSGWVTPAARKWYEEHLRQDSPEAILRRVESDLKSEHITTELYGILQSMPG